MGRARHFRIRGQLWPQPVSRSERTHSRKNSATLCLPAQAKNEKKDPSRKSSNGGSKRCVQLAFHSLIY